MSYPYARTYDEAYLYMELRPCVCGEIEFDKTTAHGEEDGTGYVRYAGSCPNCGRSRQFTFRMPAESPPISFDMHYGWGTEPSQLIDPGEWLGVADLYVAGARAELDSGDVISEDRLTAVFYLLSSARAATEEAAKFLTDGADRVPESAFRSQPGRMLLELAPHRFTRTALDGELADRRRELDAFDDRYGTEG